jgi:hypothetical protein
LIIELKQVCNSYLYYLYLLIKCFKINKNMSLLEGKHKLHNFNANFSITVN